MTSSPTNSRLRAWTGNRRPDARSNDSYSGFRTRRPLGLRTSSYACCSLSLSIPVTRYRSYLLLFGVIYTLCFCVTLPAFDEAYTYNLVTDSSLAHMLILP